MVPAGNRFGCTDFRYDALFTMLYRLYCSSGNAVGIKEYVGYFEIGDDGYTNRYIEIRTDGTAVRYSVAQPADRLGILPEGVWDETEASRNKYGILTGISKELFEAVWVVTQCSNDPPKG
jgi:hypothetical protein